MTIEIEQMIPCDHNKVVEIVSQFWGAGNIVIQGVEFDPANLAGLKAVLGEAIVGILHYQVRGTVCEILTLASLREGQGVGSALLTAAEMVAKAHGCEKLSLITTNDNLHALGFYQRRGFHLAALYPNQVTISRQIKPAIPLVADNNIPIRDELRLEKDL